MKEDTTSFVKRFKLTDEQVQIYTWLKEQKINTDDSTLCYWSKTYPPLRIKEVVMFAQERMSLGQKIVNIGGWIHNLLKNGHAVVNEVCRFNQKYVLEFTKAKYWKELKIYEKYVKDLVTGDDLPLTMAKEEFKHALERLYQKSQLYK